MREEERRKRDGLGEGRGGGRETDLVREEGRRKRDGLGERGGEEEERRTW